MEHKIMEVLRRMQSILDEIQLAELKNAMYVVFAGCKLEEETSLRTVDQSSKDIIVPIPEIKNTSYNWIL